MKIGIVGAGGIGSYYAGLLSRAGHEVYLIARGDHLRAIQARGLEVRAPNEQFIAHPIATDDGASLAVCEYVIVSVKGYSLSDVAPMIAASARGGATIVPLLNGVEAANRLIAASVSRERIMGGLAAVSLFRTEPGVVERRSQFDRIVIGELDRSRTERTQRLADALKNAGVAASVSDDIQLDLWRKFAFIVPMTVACGLSRRPIGATLSAQGGRDLIIGSVAEIAAVSRRGDAPLSPDDEARIRDDLLAVQPAIRPSFLADLERGGPTEVDILAGAVSRLGRERGVATPIHDVAATAFEAATAS
ncbi:MAG TPA: 2-dehydropantoate 2-reductase [Gemmatimonadaceae bacterium]|nr:2-dehydropantoate 2-reductase [Gemmatimonadaceae bacterium]